MIDPLDREARPLIEKLSRIRSFSAFILLSERITSYGWRSLSWILLFCGLWLFQTPEMFGEKGQILTALIFYIGLVFFILNDLRHIQWPSKRDIDRRIEHESALKHRPLNTLDDQLSNPEKRTTRDLWQEGKAKCVQILAKLKTPKSKPLLAKADPYALRFLALLFFVCGAIIAGPSWQSRIQNGLFPITIIDEEKLDDQVLITITPPEYTKLQPLTLKGSQNKEEERLSIPEGSTIKLRVHGGLGQPKLVIGDESWILEKAGKDNHMLEMPLPDGEGFEIKQFFITRSSWTYDTVKDQPPVFIKSEDHETLPESALRFAFTVYDDYSVETITMRMEIDPGIDAPPMGEPVVDTRSIFSPSNTEFDIGPVYDLTYHPWAGLPVRMSFEIADHKGQSVESEPVELVLPEREFSHPVAKSLIAMRKKLAWNPLNDYYTMGSELEQLLINPDFFGNDPAVFLSIRSAASRLMWSRPSEDVARALLSQLWDTAIHVEDGDLQLAARNLREAQQALEDTLRDPNATEEEIRQAMNELREAMAEYFAELQREFQKRIESGEQLPLMPPDMLAQNIDPEAMANFLDQLEQQLRNGDRASAQEMLSQLQRFMDMMQPNMGGQMPPDMQMMSDGINELQELIDRQKELLAQTEKQAELQTTFTPVEPIERSFGEVIEPLDESIFEEWEMGDLPPQPTEIIPETTEPQNEDMPPPPKPIINTQANKAEQEALRFILGQLMLDAAEALEEVPEAMGLAEQEMRGSSEFLGENNPRASIPHQEKAIEYLEHAQESLSQQLTQRMQQMIVMGGGQRYDPLGRPYGGYGEQEGMFPGSRVKIPDEAERRRAQEILKLLRRRSGELNRPDDELDYFRRLLRQF